MAGEGAGEEPQQERDRPPPALRLELLPVTPRAPQSGGLTFEGQGVVIPGPSPASGSPAE